MPWTGQTFAKHNKKLAKRPGASAKAAAQANAILAKTGDEGMAIAVANKNAKRGILASRMKP
jgi:uncharacterized protein YdaT